MAKVTKAAVFGKLLYQAASELKVTQTELGRRIGVSQRTVARWGQGDWYPPVPQRYAIVHALRDVRRPLLEAIAASLGIDAATIPVVSKPAVVVDAVAAKQALEAAMFAASARLDVSGRKVREALLPILTCVAELGIDAARAYALLKEG